ncbi:MAG: DMT family transporter [candidate division KSB1 bacterium]|nr:DMT family transporter [candidate division KSB1 bacterium]
MKQARWLLFSLVTVSFWGVWGALIEIPEKAGFPATLGYSVWALTMIPPAIVALKLIDWKLERDSKSVFLGSAVGFLGAGGQLILFQALRTGPAYLVFPIIALSPVVTILLAYWLLHERATRRGWFGIVLAVVAMVLLSYQSPTDSAASGYLWIVLAFLVFLAWGMQAYVIRFANRTMKAESIFFYMMLTGILLIPVALLMTDFADPINWGFTGPVLAAMIQLLNSVGALCLVYAFRYGKAIIVSPLVNAGAPLITTVISLAIYGVIPSPITAAGMIAAIASAYLMSIEPELVEA